MTFPWCGPVFERYVRQQELDQRLAFHQGDFFKDPLPSVDVLVMGHILHDWSLDEKMMLLRKAHDALPGGGALIVYDAMIDDEQNAFGLLMSLNMLIETPTGFDYTGADCRGWMGETGFRDVQVVRCKARTPWRSDGSRNPEPPWRSFDGTPLGQSKSPPSVKRAAFSPMPLIARAIRSLHQRNYHAPDRRGQEARSAGSFQGLRVKGQGTHQCNAALRHTV